ncbi:sigma-70 family RNA polymerase sigma factor [Paenibacillus sp. F411]|uniref:sigma-70 family RNA polymerase sigma factor n=1 Tax=Paenibacillus sp. F411 TaxID=2820239 RepID=UPI001AAEF5A1|nr:sigma-70 family RNA polymerase sigma factor [Paenibacillus sp. F411]
MEITEDNIVQQLRERNENGIAFIIHQYGSLLSGIIRRHVHYNPQELEECLDDVLLAIWNHIDDYDESKNTFVQWIAAIAKYRAIDYQRRMIRNEQRFVQGKGEDSRREERPPMTGPGQRDAAEVLAHLSEVERSIFDKYYLQGVPSAEIAAELQVKESWIHNKLSRGRKKLRQIFIPSAKRCE